MYYQSSAYNGRIPILFNILETFLSMKNKDNEGILSVVAHEFCEEDETLNIGYTIIPLVISLTKQI